MVKPVSYAIHDVSLVDGKISLQPTGRLELKQKPQVLNIGDFCNECGNCTTFCPTAGDPYLDKLRLHLSDQSFNDSTSGYLIHEEGIRLKRNALKCELSLKDDVYLFQSTQGQVSFDADSKAIVTFNLKNQDVKMSTRDALEMIVLYENLKENPVLIRHEVHE